MCSNSEAIKIFCSHLCTGEGVLPLEPKEWSELTQLMRANNLQPGEILGFSLDDMRSKLSIELAYAERLMRLIDRSVSLSFELSKYENMGIFVVTRADAGYPLRLKKVLGNSCPPMFYYAGDLRLLTEKYMGFVGSRSISESDIYFTKRIIGKVAECGYGIVSGGAKGIDSIAEAEGLRRGCPVVEFLSDSFLKRLKNSATVQAIQNGELVLLSVVKPDAGFNTGVAMMRNRYIYAQSAGTVVVKSELNKGGTWNGALENLKHSWCVELCWNNKIYAGNQELIRRGAMAIDEDWGGDIFSRVQSKNATLDPTQMSIFKD